MMDQQIDNPPAGSPIDSDELLELYKHYEGVIKEQLDFCFKYLNFYIGLLSALTAATIAGLIDQDTTSHFRTTLVVGPLLILLLSFIGYKTVRVFYRRYLEAWVTSLNIEAMLGLKEPITFKEGHRLPLFPSKYGGGFITQFERKAIKAVLKRAVMNGWSAEKVLEETLKRGDTLLYARAVFLGFSIAAVALFIVIVK